MAAVNRRAVKIGFDLVENPKQDFLSNRTKVLFTEA
jgi:hypothetical protein